MSLASSVQVNPNFWTDPASGTPYYLAVQTPEHRITTMDDLKNTPVGTFLGRNGTPVPGLLENVAILQRDSIPTNANHANVQPVYDIFANVEGTDLGRVSAAINKVVADLQKKLKPGNTIEVMGQIDSMNGAFKDMGLGLLFAAVFVYLLMVVNYQNFADPFVVILALPATFCGIVTMLYITGTTLNVPSLMGAIMAIGVASANSIVLVTFAREHQQAGMTAFDAAIMAGRTRIRPVLMTAAAMIAGMLPMAIGGAGEEQNAALARAVIGGLLFATPHHAVGGAIPVRRAAQGQRWQDVPRCVHRGARMNVHKPMPVPDKTSDRNGIVPIDRHTVLPGQIGKKKSAAGRFAIGALMLLAGGLAVGVWRHWQRESEVATTAAQRRDFVPAVRVALVKSSRDVISVDLPGTTEAFEAASIYSRTSGYVGKRYADIGDRVKAGDLLAEITAPELDHEIAQGQATLLQNEATLRQAEANREIANVTWGRDSQLLDKGWITKQQGDQERLTLLAQQAAVAVAQDGNVE